MALFTDDKMKKATAIAAKNKTGVFPWLPAAAHRTTTACISLSKRARDAGCDGVMVLPVIVRPLTTDEVFDHYESVRSQSTLFRICVYNNPWTKLARRHEAGISRQDVQHAEL